MPPSIERLKRTPSKRTLYTTIAVVLSSLLLGTGWLSGRNIANERLNGVVNTSARILAQQAADQLLADDRLALQNIVRRISELPEVHYAGVYDAAGTPLAESGTIGGIANTITASAKIYTESSLVGIASVSIESFSARKALRLLIIPLIIGLIVSGLYKRKNQQAIKRSNTALPSKASPLLYIKLKLTSADLSNKQIIDPLEQSLQNVVQLYGGLLSNYNDYYLLDFSHNKDANLRTTCAARLWYAAFQHLKRQQSFEFTAVCVLEVSPKLSGSDTEKRYQQAHWINQVQALSEHEHGVLISREFMALNNVANNIVIAEKDDCFVLKSLSANIDKLMRKQLIQILQP